jgi:ABC-type nitrate/sulfonate/bicarbonate transport system substrate-binding protein
VRRTNRVPTAILMALALVFAVAACGGDSAGTTTSVAVTATTVGTSSTSGETTTTVVETTTTVAAEPSKVGMAFEREGDPMVAYMIDSGLVAEMEAKYNVEFVPTESPDDLAFFAGGHGDVIQLGSYEVPQLQAETGVPTVTFGAIRWQATIWVTLADNPGNTLADFTGQTIAVNGPGGSAYVWMFLVKALHGLNLSFDGGDFNFVASGGTPIAIDMVRAGDLAATACDYTQCAGVLASGEFKVLYDGRTAGQLYSEELGGGVSGSANLWHNTLVARADWFYSHPNEVAFVLELFQRAMDAWNADPGAILTTYAADLGLDVQADAATLEYLATTAVEFDPVLASVYLTPEAIAAEKLVVQALRDAGIIGADVADTTWEVVAPPCDTAPDLAVCG